MTAMPLLLLRKNKVDLSARISTNVLLSRSEVGKGTYIGPNTIINNTAIGNYCSIAPGVQIGGMEHSHWWYSMSTRLSSHCISNKRTEIGHDVWIGAGAIIRQGVKIGSGAVIGAMSFVNKDVPPNSIVLGSPARFHRKRFPDEVFDRIMQTGYWKHDEAQARKLLQELGQQVPLSVEYA